MGNASCCFTKTFLLCAGKKRKKNHDIKNCKTVHIDFAFRRTILVLKGRKFKCHEGSLANAQVCLSIALPCDRDSTPSRQVDVNDSGILFITNKQ